MFFCKKPGHMKKKCWKYKDWKENNSVKKSGILGGRFPAINVGKRDMTQGNVGVRGKTMAGEMLAALEG